VIPDSDRRIIKRLVDLRRLVEDGVAELLGRAQTGRRVVQVRATDRRSRRVRLNLARFLSDGEQIIVPAVGQSIPASGVAGSATAGGKVNINTADEPTLETLPRVGPAMAARILAWRAANGRFTAIEDLMSVSGIGEKTFEGLKDLVTT